MDARAFSRRDFLVGRREQPVRPPGFKGGQPDICATCSQCAQHCPTNIIVHDGKGPALDFSRGECTFCGNCRDHCPAAGEIFSPAEAFSHVVQIGDLCLPRLGIDCQACRDQCPTAAIRFKPRRGGPFLPELDESACTGCGACIAVCPSDAVTVKRAKEMVDA